MRLPELDVLLSGTTIWLDEGHTFTKRGETWFCACEPNPWKWPNVRAYCQRHRVKAMDIPGTDTDLVLAGVGASLDAEPADTDLTEEAESA